MNPDNVDFVERDKRPYGEGPGFLLGASVACLASWAIAAPVAAACGVFNVPRKLLLGNGPATVDGGKQLSFPPISPALVEVLPFKDREFDLVMYGATGFTGKLACKYLARNYGTKVKWAIAGRRMDALENVKAECVKINPDMKDLVCIQVDSADESKLQSMCSRTRVVITTVGPFMRYGTPLVRACIATKSNVCDITGEIDWVAGLIDNYDEEAKKAGSKVVSCCGHDSIPWDITTYVLAKKLKESKAEELVSIEFVDAIVGKPSGGTLQTTLEYPLNGYKSSKLPFPPLQRADDGSRSQFRLRNQSHFLPYYAGTKQWTGPFIMAMVNSKVVERSNVLVGYGKSVTYMEHRAAESYSSVVGRYLQLAAAGPLLMLPDSLRGMFLPLPGEGPSEKEMEEGFLQVTGIAVGEKGSKVAGRMYCKVDAGYRDTARMLVETGLTLALSPEKCARQSGVLTPAACCGDELFQRLLRSGTEFSFASNL